MNVTNRLHFWFAAATLTTVLAACGGGGGGSDEAAANNGPSLEAPPATAVALQASATEASGATAAAADGAQRVVQLNASLSGSIPALANGGSVALSLSRAALSHTRERALARQTISCADFFDSSPSSCSGSLTVDTNASGSGTSIPAGTYATVTFNALQGSFGGSPVLVNGTLRMDYLAAFDANAASLAGLRVQFTFTNFSGTADGVSFGPLNAVALYEFDAHAVGTMTIDGLRIVGFDTLSVTDANNYSLASVTLRRAHWATPSGYVDVGFQNWNVANGRPSQGSRVAITAANSSLAIVVTSSSASTVVYGITTTINSVATSYTVTATYPAGGGAPTYTVVATPT
jgi:hypothetical protein